MKTDKIVAKHLEKQKANQPGRAPAKSLLDLKKAQYQQIGEVISEQYARSQIPENRLYMIDKVVRMRSQHGRFGIDHSELLNYELEQTNKARDDYMNLLVYKDDAQSTQARDLTQMAPVDASVSQVLFHRLQAKDEEKYSDYSQRELFSQFGGGGNDDRTPKQNQGLFGPSGTTELRRYGGSGLSYGDWLKRKDAEKRLKRKLVTQAQTEVKEELLDVAKVERDKYENRCKAMDEWLMKKKIEEAEKIAHMRELDRREEVEKQMRDERQTNSYKEWMRL